MNAPSPTIVADSSMVRRFVVAAYVLALAAILFRVGQFLVDGVAGIGFPGELDYGEGIVWEQMRQMVAGRGYAPIDGFPAIVFHYPPVYHLFTAAVAAGTGTDELLVGRAISFASTLLMALFAGLIATAAVRADASRRIALVCGGIAGLTIFCISPIAFWAPLMRVDMLSLALTLAGVLTAMKALQRPALIMVSAVLFVAAVYTKQIAIVAPAAVFLTFLLLRPRLAWGLAAGCLLLGLIVLAALQMITDGGFVRHVFLYNVNRFDPSRLVAIPFALVTHVAIAAAGFGVAARLKSRWPHYRDVGSVAELRRRLTASTGDAYFLLILVYALLASLMTLSIAKSGSNVNYFIEALTVGAILLGIVARGSVEAALAARPTIGAGLSTHPVFVPLMLGMQALMAAPSSEYNDRSAERVGQLGVLQAMVRAADRPVISDDIVLLIRANASVQWEPAIFAELAQTGAWNESPFVDRIRARDFAFFITAGARGSDLFDRRYNTPVADAIDGAYPVKQRLAGYTVHLPAHSQRKVVPDLR